jgi:hypothetical protein
MALLVPDQFLEKVLRHEVSNAFTMLAGLDLEFARVVFGCQVGLKGSRMFWPIRRGSSFCKFGWRGRGSSCPA